jgi:glucose-6-phosphate 1-dehydrogenase
MVVGKTYWRQVRPMATGPVDALVIFGATGDLAKLETFPALVGLVERGVLDSPVIGVAKSGWGLEQFRDYAGASLRLNDLEPGSRAAEKLLGLLRYVDGDLDDDATYKAIPTSFEDAIYWVDHWLGLEALNNALVARFANSIFALPVTATEVSIPPADAAGAPLARAPTAERGGAA